MPLAAAPWLTLPHPIFPRWPSPGPRLRHQRLILTPEGAIAKVFPPKSCHDPFRRCLDPFRPCLDPPHKMLPPSPSADRVTPTPPETHCDDLRPVFVHHPPPHPEAHASRSRPIRSTMAANSLRGTATSASWKTRYLAC